MKLRIQASSVRLRVTPSEVHALATRGKVESFVQLGLGEQDRLTYSLEVSAELVGPSLTYGDRAVRIILPESMVREWASSEQVGIEAQQRVADGGMVRILVEKDFRCLEPRPGENESDRFPHPGQLVESRSDS
jgi:hypothetical protein